MSMNENFNTHKTFYALGEGGSLCDFDNNEGGMEQLLHHKTFY